MQKKAVVLLSGGIDSTTTLAIAQSEGYEVYGMSFRYGQRHQIEVTSAHNVSAHLGVKTHVDVDIDLRQFGGSALTENIDVPTDRDAAEMSDGIPATYVPARNTIFLSFATAWSETLGAKSIFIGVNALDYSGYPDCRPEYIEAYELMANLATRSGVEDTAVLRIHTPLIDLTKAEIIRKGLSLGVAYEHTWSCYDPKWVPFLKGPADPAAETAKVCGVCDSCILRAKGFAELALIDPLLNEPADPIIKAYH